MFKKLSSFILACVLLLAGAVAAKARGCPTDKDEIETDRPDLTNSSVVVPDGSLQSENGINLISRDGAFSVSATNSRLRFGVAPCVEILVDLPAYFAALESGANSGATHVVPAIKWQVSPAPGVSDLSLIAGLGLPTGSADIAGRGVQPYVQLPWSWEWGGVWALKGQTSGFFFPSEPEKLVVEQTLSLERELGSQASMFIEYAGQFPKTGSSSHILNTGAAYRPTKTEQLDFNVAVGLDPDAPDFIVGMGYSFRIDRLY
jgi:hypothetical protein